MRQRGLLHYKLKCVCSMRWTSDRRQKPFRKCLQWGLSFSSAIVVTWVYPPLTQTVLWSSDSCSHAKHQGDVKITLALKGRTPHLFLLWCLTTGCCVPTSFLLKLCRVSLSLSEWNIQVFHLKLWLVPMDRDTAVRNTPQSRVKQLPIKQETSVRLLRSHSARWYFWTESGAKWT